MWISLLTLLLLLVTPISCRAEIRQEHGTRFRILLRIWGIPLRFDHSQAPMRPNPPSAQQLQKGKALLRALLEPTAQLRQLENDGDYTARLALLEEQKSLPWQAIWEMYCQRHDTPAGSQWLDSVRAYENAVLSQRG